MSYWAVGHQITLSYKYKESVIVCALALKAHCAFNSEQALPHCVAFRATLKRKASRCDTPGFCVFGVVFGYFLLVLVVGFGFVLVFWVFFHCFRHADVLACFQWFWGVYFWGVCVLALVGVSLSLAAQRGWFSSVEVDGPAGVVVV